MVRMKALARSYIWWPGYDSDIEGMVKSCNRCCLMQLNPTPATLHPWEWPGKPWVRLHIDYAGPVEGKYVLVIVDAHSKFINCHVVDSQTTQLTLRKLRETFAICGLPQTIVSDNGSCFTSHEFEEFCRQNGIKHARSSPFHPSSNGAAERAVQTVKNGVKKMQGGDLHTRLSRFLLTYNSTPQSTTGVTPAELLMKRTLRTRLSLVLPDVGAKVVIQQGKEVDSRRGRIISFNIGDSVYCRNYAGFPYWIPGVLEERLGPLTFTARLSDGRVWKRHADQLNTRLPEDAPPELPAPSMVQETRPYPVVRSAQTTEEFPTTQPTTVLAERDSTPLRPSGSIPATTGRTAMPPAVRQSARQRQPPAWQTSGEYEIRHVN